MLTTYQKQAKIKLTMTVITLIVIAGVIMLTDAIKPKSRSAALAVTTSAPITPSASRAAPATSSPAVSSSASSQSAAPPPSSSLPAAIATSSTSGYKDGTYSAGASYYVPHSNQSIQVSLTLSNGVITNASIQNSESDPTSASYQQDFASIYKSSVIGQKISRLQLSITSGASDTTQGFNDALRQISMKAQA